MTIYGFGSLEDASRVIHAALGIEGQRELPRGRSGRQPADAPIQLVRARTRATFAVDTSQTCDVLVRNDAGQLVTNGEEITTYNMFGTIQANRNIMVAMMVDGCEVIAARC